MSLEPKQPSWEELPKSIFPVNRVSLSQYNPVELDRIAARSETIKEIPGGLRPLHKKMISTLAQYRGRTPEGRRRSLENLNRNMSTTTLATVKPTLPEGMPVIPTAILPPRLLADAKARRVRAVLSQDEYAVYVDTWSDWIGQHADYNQAEDEKDLCTVCMEEAQQFRYQLYLGKKPNDKQTQIAYNQSFERQQQARDNLAARRDLRLGITTKGKAPVSIGSMSISIMAGQVDEKKLQQMESQAKQIMTTDFDQLGKTTDLPPKAEAEIIDAEFAVKDENNQQKMEG